MVVDVAIGLICNKEGLYCVSQRRADAHMAACWEFPGGKCMPGESMLAALQRELQEELGIVVQQATCITTTVHDYPGRSVSLHVFRVDAYQGLPRGMEAQPLRWVSVPQLAKLAMPAANQAILVQLTDAMSHDGL